MPPVLPLSDIYELAIDVLADSMPLLHDEKWLLVVRRPPLQDLLSAFSKHFGGEKKIAAAVVQERAGKRAVHCPAVGARTLHAGLPDAPRLQCGALVRSKAREQERCHRGCQALPSGGC
eukprot:6206246-Pleurochrysis_carterae.AAC.3